MEDWLYYSLSIALCLAFSLLSSLRRPPTATGEPCTPPLPPGPTALMAALGLGPLLLFAWTSFNIEPIIRIYRARTAQSSPSTSSLPSRSSSSPTPPWRATSWSSAAPPSLAGRRRTSPPASSPATSTPSPPRRTARSGVCSAATSPPASSTHLASSAASSLVEGVKQQMRAGDGEGVVIVEGLLHQAVYRVLTAMCFGEGLDGGAIAAVEELHREFLKSVVGFQVFGGAITKLLFWRRYRKMLSIRRRQEELIIPLIRARRRRHDAGVRDDDGACYVDSLLGLRIPEADGGDGGRSLTELEMVSLCTEFLSGADSMDHGEPRRQAGHPSKAPCRDRRRRLR
ncbi:unnamed protein product [Urochloa humidicola]